jgi:type II secretory pathway pseudopilin PulG
MPDESHTPPSRRHGAAASRRRAAGFTLVDLMMALAILGILLHLAAPALDRLSQGMEIRLAAKEVAGALLQARQYAITHNVKVGVKFRTEDDGRVTLTIYRDGNENGVRNRDIESGDDPEERSAQVLNHLGERVRFGFPEGPMPRRIQGRGPIDRRDDPIRFGRADIATFNPRGTASPGTIYLTDGRLRGAAVRVTAHTGQIRVFILDPRERQWRWR